MTAYDKKLNILKSAGLTDYMISRANRNKIDIDTLIKLLELVGDLILKILPLFLRKK